MANKRGLPRINMQITRFNLSFMLLVLSFGYQSSIYGMEATRYNIAPNRTNCMLLKTKLESAKGGAKILKKKAKKLQKRFRVVLEECKAKKLEMGAQAKLSAAAMARTKFICAQIAPSILSAVTDPTFTVKEGMQRIQGVATPSFEAEIKEQKKNWLGLHQGGQQIAYTRKLYLETLISILKIAELQTSFISLDEEIKNTKRRANVIEKVIQPKLERTIQHIENEIAESERENYYRYKKIKQKKQAEMDLAESEKKEWERNNLSNQEENMDASDSEDILF